MVLFKSKAGNNYLYNSTLKQFLLIHPIEVVLIQLFNDGMDISKLLNKKENCEGEIYVPKFGFVNKLIVRKHIEKVFFFDKQKFLTKNYIKSKSFIQKWTPKLIEESLVNTKHIVFEVTNICNLKCKYCGFGDLYCNTKNITFKNLSLNKAKLLIDYMFSLWSQSEIAPNQDIIYIGFYGGEPLLNFELIKQIVQYLKSKVADKSILSFSMTTNGLLLNNYIDFLVENNFRLLISIDGNRKNNMYRLYPNGNESFMNVVYNINALFQLYPKYFEEKVNFNSVLHNRNSYEEIIDYIYNKFNKIPKISELVSVGIMKKKQIQFKMIYKSKYMDIICSKKQKELEKLLYLDSPRIYGLTKFLKLYCNNAKNDYNSLIHEIDYYNKITTGTCLPFSIKVYQNSHGDILPCESIRQFFSLGKTYENRIIINYTQIAEIYNNYFKKIYKMCNKCLLASTCVECIFKLNINEKNVICKNFMDEKRFSKYLSINIDLLEESPNIYSNLMTKLFIGN